MIRFQLVLVLLTTGLTGCIPTIERIYDAPSVTGVVIDAETLEPVPGARVRHIPGAENKSDEEYDEFVTSDANGRFLLHSISHVRPSMRMVGHALEDYFVQVQYGDDFENTIDVGVKGSAHMMYPESYDVAVFVDSNPGNLAPLPEAESLSEAELIEALKPMYQHCDEYRVDNALHLLNGARKALGHHRSSQAVSSDASASASIILSDTVIVGAYKQVEMAWGNLNYRCRVPFDTEHRKAMHDTLDKVEEESWVVRDAYRASDKQP